VGQVAAGSAHNIIPEKCVLRGTVRYFDKGLEQFLPRRIEEIAVGIARAMRADADVEYNLGYRPVINDEEITQFLKESARTIVGPEKVVDIQEPTMGAEDMSYYLEKVPGTFIGIGTANKEKGTAYPNHHPKFDVDEDVLHIASAVFARACIDYLSRN
ncbi:MAG: M20/M25/M40 family metallo-hydrolase, partial [Bacillota bacterium]